MPMPRNEDGEFEMVLGNKQLLTIFFLVIILLGVFFTMGYVLGRNSGPVDAAATSAAEASRDARLAGKQTAMVEPAGGPAADENRRAYPRSSTVPAAPQTELAKSGEVPEPVEIVPQATGGIEPRPGTYIQVLAVARPEAELLTEVLVKKGFRAFVAAGPNEELFRVLVGPTRDSADTIKTKAELAEAGFAKAFVKKF